MSFLLAAQIASAGLKGIAGMQSAKAENERRRREYERALEIRKRGFLQQRSVYAAKINKYNIDLNENDLAANRGYEKARATIGGAISSALAKSESAFMKMTKEKLGKRAASGMTGRSAARYETMVSAEYGRKLGNLAFALTRSQEAAIENMESIRRQAKSARNKMFSQVAFQPVPSLAPQPPQMMNTTMPLLGGIVGGLAGMAEGDETPNLFGDTDGGLSMDVSGMSDSLFQSPFNNVNFNMPD